ncbi:hypothetical protein O3P69_014055 [Scylla paramamosain]|uniref:Uncharacterized protein n=1 Tax=Scylla paramamosain TaxID=85552 RepID=A0AAW0SS67_SCYPA
MNGRSDAAGLWAWVMWCLSVGVACVSLCLAFGRGGEGLAGLPAQAHRRSSTRGYWYTECVSLNVPSFSRFLSAVASTSIITQVVVCWCLFLGKRRCATRPSPSKHPYSEQRTTTRTTLRHTCALGVLGCEVCKEQRDSMEVFGIISIHSKQNYDTGLLNATDKQ